RPAALACQPQCPATNTVCGPLAATYVDHVPPPHAWHQLTLPNSPAHAGIFPIPLSCDLLAIRDGTFGNVAARPHTRRGRECRGSRKYQVRRSTRLDLRVHLARRRRGFPCQAD